MARETVYLETSVVSYYTARASRDVIVLAHQQITQDWWKTAVDRFEIFISEIVVEEAGAGDADAAEKRLEAIKNFAHLELTAETERLAEQYVRELEIPHKAIRDSVHLALASIHQVDYLVTWNCTHIANGRVMKRVREINAANGIPSPIICTPEELLESETDVERPDR